MEIGFMWLRLGGQVAGCCEHGNEPSVTITDVKFLRHQSVLWWSFHCSWCREIRVNC